MSEIQSVTNYWEEFFKTHPDPIEFRSLVVEDSVLTKIFNFSSVPWIWKDLKNYPFDAKKAELKTISKEDKKHLAQRCFQADAKYVEWFDYLSNLFDVVFSTLILKGFLDIKAKKEGIKDEEILKLVESKFHKFISRDEIIILKEVDGIQKSIRRYGRYYPIRWINFIETRDRNRGMIERVYQEHFILPPSEEIIEQTLRDLDRYSVINIGKYGKEIDDICFGSPDSIKNIVELYYKGKRLGEPFPVPISERYRPLGEKLVKSLRNRFGDLLGTKKELLVRYDEELFKKALRYDPSSDVYPAGYFDAALNYFEKEMFEDLSTTAFDVPCDSHCKAGKEHMNKLPCEFEDSLGYCSDPKRQRVLKSVIEAAGGRFGHPIINKQGEESKEKLEDVLEEKDHPTPEEIVKKKELLEQIYKHFPKLENIIAKEEQEITLSVKERQIKHRAQEELKRIKKST
jgi:hypothetical protein